MTCKYGPICKKGLHIWIIIRTYVITHTMCDVRVYVTYAHVLTTVCVWYFMYIVQLFYQLIITSFLLMLTFFFI